MNSIITFIILIVTCIVSISCFKRKNWFNSLEFNAYQIIKNKQYYRLFTHGLIHGNWMHLIVNMLVLFSFGPVIETYFAKYAIGGSWLYLVLYVLSLPASCLISLKKYRNNLYYNAVGASGAVTAVVFAFVFLDPWSKLYLFFALPIPGIVFGGLYLWYSYKMSNKENDGIGHDAHFLGALFGIIFTAVFIPGSFTNFFIRLFDF